MQGYI